MPRGGARPGAGRKAGDPNHPRRGNGAGKGDGWGEEARGASTSRIDDGAVGDAIRKLGRDPAHMATKEAKAELVLEHLFGLALTAERQETQVSAAVAYSNRVAGLPIARQLTAVTDEARVLRIEIVDEPSDAPHGSEAGATPARIQH